MASEISTTFAFSLDTIYGVWEVEATGWRDGALTVNVAQYDDPYYTPEYEIIYDNGSEVTPERLADDIRMRCEP